MDLIPEGGLLKRWNQALRIAKRMPMPGQGWTMPGQWPQTEIQKVASEHQETLKTFPS